MVASPLNASLTILRNVRARRTSISFSFSFVIAGMMMSCAEGRRERLNLLCFS